MLSNVVGYMPLGFCWLWWVCAHSGMVLLRSRHSGGGGSAVTEHGISANLPAAKVPSMWTLRSMCSVLGWARWLRWFCSAWACCVALGQAAPALAVFWITWDAGAAGVVPATLLFPAPVALGLGQVYERVIHLLAAALQGSAFARGYRRRCQLSSC